jgi:NAD-dependent deacetylase
MTHIPSVVISDELRSHLTRRQNVFVLTGAGVSAESGVPTFRGGGGAAVWRGMPFEQLSSRKMVEENLPLVWEWFDYRLEAVRACAPNPAHETIAHWQDKFDSLTLATQNIDGLHARAGSRDVLELHGSLRRMRCTYCHSGRELRQATEEARTPKCSECGAAMRPDVVLFGEMSPEGVFERAEADAEECDLCFIIGTSALVYPAVGLIEVAWRSGAYMIEVNPEETPLSSLCHETLRGRAGDVLPQLQIR